MSDEAVQDEKKGPEAEGEASQRLSYGLVEPERIRVWEDPFRKVCVSVDGTQFTDVRARLAFPLSGKADYISFLDDKGKEVVLLDHPRRLDKDSRSALDETLGRMYYVAKITRVDSITETWGVSHWQVETDKGYASFEVTDRTSIRRLGDGRIVIADADGNRFEVADLSQLDQRSQALVSGET